MENSVQLIMKINFISSLDTGKFLMHTKSDNIEIMSGIETNDIMNERFKSFLKRYQVELETKMKGSGFISERADLLYYMIHKISLDRCGSYIDSPYWTKSKKATINLKHKDNECFKYAIEVALNHEKIKKNRKEYQKLSLLSISITGKESRFHRIQRIGKNLNKIIRQLLLISYL